MKTIDHRREAMALLTSGAPLRPKEGSFLGQLAFDANPPTEKQAHWLAVLMERHGPKKSEGDVQ